MSSSKIAMANRLRELRLARGLLQSEIAQKAGMTKQLVSHIEVGRVQMNQTSMQKLAGALGCHPGELFPIEPPRNLSQKR